MMTSLDIDVAIAQAIGTHTAVRVPRPGFDDYLVHRLTDRNGHSAEIWGCGSSSHLDFEWPLKYSDSLDTIHAAIETRWHDAKFRVMYSAMLYSVCDHSDIDVCHATALQHAEAFCRVKGLWIEDSQ